MQNGATAGFVTGKGDAAYAQVKLGDTTLLLLSDGIYQDGEHTYAMCCDVYGVGEDGTPVQIGELLSEGTGISDLRRNVWVLRDLRTQHRSVQP